MVTDCTADVTDCTDPLVAGFREESTCSATDRHAVKMVATDMNIDVATDMKNVATNMRIVATDMKTVATGVKIVATDIRMKRWT